MHCTLFLLALILLQPATNPAAAAPDDDPVAGGAENFADRWSVTNVVRRPLVDVLARDNPLPLYWAGSLDALPAPQGVPIVGEVPTFAAHVLGFWPQIDAKGNVVYGGTPIGHNLNLHLAKIREQLTDPNAKPYYAGDRVRRAGFICFDFEAFPIAWDRVSAPYRELAIKQIRERNPDAVRYMTDEQVEALTAREWERRANEIFVRSAETVRATIPGTKVGYYGITVQRKTWPDAWPMDDPHADEWRRLNEVAMPTIAASDVLFPSVYNFYDGGGNDGMGYIKLNVGEARRLADLATAKDGKPRLVLPFVWGLYHPSNKTKSFQPVDADDVDAQVFGSFEAGADGLAIWDSNTIWRDHRDVPINQFRAKIWPLYTQLYAAPYGRLVAREVLNVPSTQE